MTNAEAQKKLSGLNGIIGDTPMFKIDFKYRGQDRSVYAKAEFFNLTGSIKDRCAYHIISDAYESDSLRSDMTIMEATSGSTGIAFAAIGRMMGHDVTIFMPEGVSTERINIIKSFGAQVRLVSKEEGGFSGCIKLMEEEYRKNPQKVFLPRQFDNHKNCETHYSTTGPEIANQMASLGLAPDAFVAGVGTGGTVMGVGRFLRTINKNARIHPLETSNSPTMTIGYKCGSHRIQGLSDEFIPSIVNLCELDKIIQVDDGDSIIMAQKLARELGLGVGISSGANLLGAIIAQNLMGGSSNVVTVFPDDNKKYLTTDYSRAEPVKEGFISTDVELCSVMVIK